MSERLKIYIEHLNAQIQKLSTELSILIEAKEAIIKTMQDAQKQPVEGKKEKNHA